MYMYRQVPLSMMYDVHVYIHVTLVLIWKRGEVHDYSCIQHTNQNSYQRAENDR